jgi:hypothetical protein
LYNKGKDEITMYELHKTPEFENWLQEQPLKARLQVERRLLHIVIDGHSELVST